MREVQTTFLFIHFYIYSFIYLFISCIVFCPLRELCDGLLRTNMDNYRNAVTRHDTPEYVDLELFRKMETTPSCMRHIRVAAAIF